MTACGSEATSLVESAMLLRWRAPELALLLADRAAAAAGDNPMTVLRATHLAVFALNCLGRQGEAARRLLPVLGAADTPLELQHELQVELAHCAMALGEPAIALAALQPVLAVGEDVAPVLRGTALVTTAESAGALGRSDIVSSALDEADELFCEDTNFDRDTVLLLRATARAVNAAHHRRNGAGSEAEALARAGRELLTGLADPDHDNGQVGGRLMLETVLILLDRGAGEAAVREARPLLQRPVRAAAAGAVGLLRLALATRVHLAEGRHEPALALLADAVEVTQRHSMDGILAECLEGLSYVHEVRGEFADALHCVRSARAAEGRHRRIVESARAALLEYCGSARRQMPGLIDHIAALLPGLGGRHPSAVHSETAEEPVHAQHPGRPEYLPEHLAAIPNALFTPNSVHRFISDPGPGAPTPASIRVGPVADVAVAPAPEVDVGPVPDVAVASVSEATVAPTHAADNPQHDRPQHDRPQHDRPQHDRPQHDRPQHDRPQHDRPQHRRPQHDRAGHDPAERSGPVHVLPSPLSGARRRRGDSGTPVLVSDLLQRSVLSAGRPGRRRAEDRPEEASAGPAHDAETRTDWVESTHTDTDHRDCADQAQVADQGHVADHGQAADQAQVADQPHGTGPEIVRNRPTIQTVPPMTLVTNAQYPAEDSPATMNGEHPDTTSPENPEDTKPPLMFSDSGPPPAPMPRALDWEPDLGEDGVSENVSMGDLLAGALVAFKQSCYSLEIEGDDTAASSAADAGARRDTSNQRSIQLRRNPGLHLATNSRSSPTSDAAEALTDPELRLPDLTAEPLWRPPGTGHRSAAGE